ncbi:phage head-binding domain-containing protein [Escherichia albertii]|uniref:phage head-binding domain-containing protein n=1 Tax=Escherichia albertii TaxID=208962 RepID=UPI000A18528E|nr:phage head-binding domain-containing protein [Escherichia albertii]OSL33888.1 bifunctional tail protein [Escherichia albertii B156]
MTDITANVVVSMPSQLFTMARSFKAVANGKIYIGKIDTDPVNPENQIQVYVENEDGSHVPVSQPIIINAAGYPVYNGQIAKFVTVQGHSMAVYDAHGAQQFYFPNVLKYDPDQLRNELSGEHGSFLIGGVIDCYSTVSDLISSSPSVGRVCRTIGYYSPGDGGGADYIISIGTPMQDFSDSGSIVIDECKFAKLIQQSQYDLKQFGVKPSDPSYAEKNDIFISQAITRSRVGRCKIIISDVIYHKKPLIFDYYNHMEGSCIGSDPEFTPRFIKIDNTTSGLPDMGYPGVADVVSYDVDAGIIIKRQNSGTSFARGFIIKGFLLQSEKKSAWAIYAPHMADFDIDIDSRGFNGGIRWFVNFLGRMAGRHIGLGANSSDPTLSIGAWCSKFSTIPDCGNSVVFRLSFNGFNRGMQMEYFGNGVLDRVTLENISKPTPTSPTTHGIYATDTWLTGQVSCESSSTCIIRAGNNANFDITLSAVFHVTQDDPSEGIVHVLNGGRLTLRSSTILADLADTKIINENGGYLDIAANTRTGNIVYSNSDNYRFKDRTIGFGQTAATTKTSFSSGEEITFSLLNGTPKANLSGGTIQFNSPCLIKITVQGRGITSGALTFGINGESSESVSQGQQVSMVVGVVSGDILNLKATSSLTLGSAGGVRVLLEPVN